jgi:hypothetical protein
MLVWGLMGTILVKFLYPILTKLINKIPNKLRKTLFITLLIFITIDILISYTSFFRMVMRKKGYPPKTFIGEVLDSTYNDEFMYNEFPILKGKL